MRSELAAARAHADEIGGIIFCGCGRIVRSSADRIAPARCPALKEDPSRLFERTSTSSSQRIDAGWAGGRFHACGTRACAATWMPADHAWSNHPASGNCSNLLPEYSLARTADLVRHLKPEATQPSPPRLQIRWEDLVHAQSGPAARVGLKQ